MIALLLLGCSDTVWFPPSLWGEETGWWRDSGRVPAGAETGAATTGITPAPSQGLRVDTASASCTPDGTAWLVSATTTGWTGRSTVRIVDVTDGVAEEHPLDLVASDPSGAWDQLAVGPLLADVDPAAQVPGESTRFDCGLEARDLSFVVEIWGTDQALADCAVWGGDPAGATALVRGLDPDVTSLGGCRVLGP